MNNWLISILTHHIVHEWWNLLRSCLSFSPQHTSESTCKITWENGVLTLWWTCKAHWWGQGQLNWSSLVLLCLCLFVLVSFVLLNTTNLFDILHCFSSELLACQNYCNSMIAHVFRHPLLFYFKVLAKSCLIYSGSSSQQRVLTKVRGISRHSKNWNVGSKFGIFFLK